MVGNSLKSAKNLAKSAVCDDIKFQIAGLPMVRSQTVGKRESWIVKKDLGAHLYYFK